MKRYMLYLSLTVLILVAFTACDEVDGASTIANETEPAHAAFTYQEQVLIQDQAQDPAEQTVSWQEAYAYKLFSYVQQPIHEPDTPDAQWRFMVHDINQNGIPELFVVLYYNGRVDHRYVYTFVDDSIDRLKTNISNSRFTSGGIILPPNGEPGIVRVISAGHVVGYDKYTLHGTTLSRTTNGDVTQSVDSFRINTHPTTETEFEYVFGPRDQKVWLTLHEITGPNVADIIFGW